MSTQRIHRIAGKRPNGKLRRFSWVQAIREWQRAHNGFADQHAMRARRWGKSWTQAMQLATAIARGDVVWREDHPITVDTKGRIAIHYDASVSPDGKVTTAPGYPHHREPRPFKPVRDFGPWVDPEAIQREINATFDEGARQGVALTDVMQALVAGVDNPTAPVVSDPEETIDP